MNDKAPPQDSTQGFRIGQVAVDPDSHVFTGPDDTVQVEPLVIDLAAHLARHPDQVVSRETLIDAVWHGYPGADQSLTNTASKLRQALQRAGGDPRQLKTVPKRGYRLAGPVHRANGSGRGIRRQRVALALGGALALAAAGLAAWWLTTGGAGAQPSVAVLAFDDLSPGGDHQYLSHGLSEELLSLLGQVPELKVPGRTSAFAFRGSDATIPEIAEALGVKHVVEGSVRKDGNRVRISVQLIGAGEDRHIWADTYEAALDDVFAVQERIATRVAQELRARLVDSVPTPPRTDAGTYDLFLRARHLSHQGYSKAGQRARELVAEALERDPEYVPALTLMSRLAMRAGDAAAAGRALDKALALDPENGVATAYQGWRVLLERHQPARAAELIGQALARAPDNAEVLRVAGRFARTIGAFDDAIALAQRSLQADPLCGPCRYNLAHAYMYAGRLEEAAAAIRGYQLQGDGGWITLGNIRLLAGDPEGALAAYDRQRPPAGHEAFWLSGRVMALHDLGRTGEAEQTLARLAQRWGEQRPRAVARACAWTGRKDQAFEWLHRGIAGYLDVLIGNPFFRALHDDPHWRQLLADHGLDPRDLEQLELRLPAG